MMDQYKIFLRILVKYSVYRLKPILFSTKILFSSLLYRQQ